MTLVFALQEGKHHETPHMRSGSAKEKFLLFSQASLEFMLETQSVEFQKGVEGGMHALPLQKLPNLYSNPGYRTHNQF